MDAQKTTPQALQSHDLGQRPDDLWLKLKGKVAYVWRWLFDITVIVLLVAILGSLNQLYKAINTLTEFNANALMKPQIYQGAAPNQTQPASSSSSATKK